MLHDGSSWANRDATGRAALFTYLLEGKLSRSSVQTAATRIMTTRGTHTATRVLDVAERLAQTRGFNGFSYADIAAELGVTKASLHYHFESKTALGCAIVERYSEGFFSALERIVAGGADAPTQLERYARLYGDVLKAGRICLCGMLAAEYTTLPTPMQKAIRAFFDRNERWLARVLDDGREAGTLRFTGKPRDVARAVTAGLEGALLLARPYGQRSRFNDAASRVIRELSTPRR
ncbi:MAG: TetR/AcrR family transcriptional regulator [Vicinamibacterales bacterium]